MALVVKDRVKELSTTTGTGSVTLTGAADGFQSFASALSNGDTTYYAIIDAGTGDFEIGLGTYSAGVLSRDTILESSNAGLVVNLQAGEKEVFVTYPAEKAVYYDGSGNIVVDNSAAGAFTVNTFTGAQLNVQGNLLQLKRAAAPFYINNDASGGSIRIQGRDIAVDGAKLDGIEAGATADQTKADIDALGINAATLGGNNASYFTGYTDTAISNLVAAAPGTLDTLNELAAALGDDPNFATTVTNSIATKLPLSGGTMTGNIAFGDSNKATFGADSDLQIYHFNEDNYIVGSRKLILWGKTLTGNSLVLGAADATYATFDWSGAAKLYYSNSAKLATTSTGVDVTGSITVSGTVDGRDVAADGTKLDGIESGATADQTITAGAGLTGGGTGDVTISHADTSTQVSVNNSGANVIQDVTLDTYGHVTGLASTTLTAATVGAAPTVHTHDDRYYTEAESDSRFVNVTGDTMTGTLTAPTLKVSNDASDTAAHRLTVYDSGAVSYGMMLWNSNGASGEWSTMIYGPNQPGRRISFGKINNTVFSNHSDVTEIAYFDLDDSTLRLDADAYVGANRVFHDGYHPNADKWTTARTLTLNGDVSGSVAWDGSGNVTLTTTVADDSHNHDGRYYTESEADSRFVNSTGDTMTGTLNVPHLYADRYFQTATGVPTNNLGSPTVTEMALFDNQFTNKTAFHPTTHVFFETSTDNVNWTDFPVSDTVKKRFVGGDRIGTSVSIPNGTPYFRVRFRATSYVFLNAMYSYWSANGHNTQVHVYKRLQGTGAWIAQHTSSTLVSSWPGHLYLPFSTIPFNPSNASQYDEVAFVFIPSWNSSFPSNSITLSNFQVWGGYPSARRNTYSVDEDKNHYFPFEIYANDTNVVWHAGNDGSGSGLDADLLDGQHGSYYYSPANAPDPTLTINGDASGSATFTNLGNATLTLTVADDSHNHSSSSGDFSIGGALTINGSTTRGTYTTASQYHSGADNIVLKGNASGISSIFFESEKDGTNINHPSDFGFIQYHAYGTSTTGEANELIIGVSNDADDHVVLNAPNAYGLKFRVGVSNTDYNIWHAGNDGSGSGLDADLLDGQHASAFATAAQGAKADTAIQPNANATLNNISATGTFTAAGDVGIGTSSPASYAGFTTLNIKGGGASTGGLIQLDTSDASKSAFMYVASDGLRLETGSPDPVLFSTSGAERMRIDTSGNVLVGKTTTAPTTTGIVLSTLGYVAATRSNSAAGSFRRINSDGNILEFRAGGLPALGSIGLTNSGTNIYYTGGSGKSGVEYDTSAWVPWYNQTRSNAVVDLGASSNRFKDLYLSGTATATAFVGDGSGLTNLPAATAKNDIFWENGQTVTTNYTITNGKNAMSAGPITINSGVTVTVGAGETWTVV